MRKIKITTNLPGLIVQIWNGHTLVDTKHGTSKVIPYSSDSGGKSSECVITIDSLEKGVYAVRLLLPYFNGPDINQPGAFYDMPVVMDKVVILDKEDSHEEIIFLASLNKTRTFESLFAEVAELNKLDPASHEARLAKLAEEFGEIAKAVCKAIGRKILKEHETEETVLQENCDEGGDTIQNVMSLLQGMGFTAEDILLSIQKGNVNWRAKLNERRIKIL